MKKNSTSSVDATSSGGASSGEPPSVRKVSTSEETPEVAKFRDLVYVEERDTSARTSTPQGQKSVGFMIDSSDDSE